MTTTQRGTLALVSSVSLLFFVLYAEKHDAFSEASTYVGIAVGLAFAIAAALIIRRVRGTKN